MWTFLKIDTFAHASPLLLVPWNSTECLNQSGCYPTHDPNIWLCKEHKTLCFSVWERYWNYRKKISILDALEWRLDVINRRVWWRWGRGRGVLIECQRVLLCFSEVEVRRGGKRKKNQINEGTFKYVFVYWDQELSRWTCEIEYTCLQLRRDVSAVNII